MMDGKLIRTLLGSLALSAVLALPTAAQEDDPYTRSDGSWITLDGTVESVMSDAFILDYGEGIITVEMDDGDRDADGYKLAVADRVTVSGRIDDDFFESATIEAASVFVENIGTVFYASSLDDEDYIAPVVVGVPPRTQSRAVLEGTVTSVAQNEFMIDTGHRTVQVEVDEMTYNPLDDEGYQKIEVGDRVQVTGEINFDFFDGRVLKAQNVITLFTG